MSYELNISFTTVRTHMHNVFCKLSVQNRTALTHKLMSLLGWFIYCILFYL
ncbi:LuxR C-terminal-related transcriptional regulator [Kistimonas asteriae]|uniref:LuxR C-terminal-related transcriptional regulator n=1 Tax=Kistimonas asteriae TaxID=517724 RepID=UPI003CCE5CC7